MNQTFGLSLKYYKAKQRPEVLDVGMQKYDGNDNPSPEGAYSIFAEGNHSFKFSEIDPSILYESGKNVEQWTIKFRDALSKQYCIMKVRNSKLFNDFIEIEVEMNSVNVDDNQGKDVTVNFRMYDGFDTNNTFWTDSNGLEMQKRIRDF